MCYWAPDAWLLVIRFNSSWWLLDILIPGDGLQRGGIYPPLSWLSGSLGLKSDPMPYNQSFLWCFGSNLPKTRHSVIGVSKWPLLFSIINLVNIAGSSLIEYPLNLAPYTDLHLEHYSIWMTLTLTRPSRPVATGVTMVSGTTHRTERGNINKPARLFKQITGKCIKNPG